MKENFHSQKGLTLVEVLVSIVLLAIILTSFMGFFTQSAIFNKKNGEKLSTMQTAQKYISLVEENSKNIKKQQINNKLAGAPSAVLSASEISALFDPTITIDNSTYYITAMITKNNVPTGLIQFKIIVQKSATDTTGKSETYTYLRESEMKP